MDERRSECMRGVESSEIRGGPRKDLIAEARRVYEFSKLDPFQKTALRFYDLLKFVKDESMKMHNLLEWKYSLAGKFHKDEMEWFLGSLENPDEEYEVPEFIGEHRERIGKINNDREFFDQYYSFYLEYLEAWGEEAFDNYYESLPNRLKAKWDARKEIEKLKGVSSRFFAKFRKTHPVFTNNR